MADQLGSDQKQLEANLALLELDGVDVDVLRNMIVGTPSREGELGVAEDSQTGDFEGMSFISSGNEIAVTGGKADVSGISGEISLQGYQYGHAIPDTLIDNYESADADPPGVYESGETIADYYSGATADASRTTDAIVGGHSLEYVNADQANRIVSTPGGGLNRYFADGETASVLLRSNAADVEKKVAFGASDVDNMYVTQFTRDSVGEFRIQKISGGSLTDLNTSTPSYNVTDLHEFVIQRSGSDLTVTAYNYDTSSGRGSEIDTLSATDSEHQANDGIGFVGGGADSGDGTSAGYRADQFQIV